MKLILLSILLFSFSVTPMAEEGQPDCSGTERWPTSMAFSHLKNAGITNNEELDFAKTVTKRVASEKIGLDLYRQVHHITFTEKTGHIIQVITINDASHEECSMSGVKVHVISRELE